MHKYLRGKHYMKKIIAMTTITLILGCAPLLLHAATPGICSTINSNLNTFKYLSGSANPPSNNSVLTKCYEYVTNSGVHSGNTLNKTTNTIKSISTYPYTYIKCPNPWQQDPSDAGKYWCIPPTRKAAHTQ